MPRAALLRGCLIATVMAVGNTALLPANEAGAPEPGAVRVNPKDALEYVWIPPGEFQMGCVEADPDCDVLEKPTHRVAIRQGFWMGRTEVPLRAYQAFTKKARKKLPPEPARTDFGGLSLGAKSISKKHKDGPGKKEDHPIVNVTWDEAHAFCASVGGRLPTEAEWEYAGRGGEPGKVYPWGNAISHENANYGNLGGRDQWRYTAPVASFEPNAFGLHDMAGNAWEWTADWFGNKYYAESPSANPPGPREGQEKVVRGGSYAFGPKYLRTSTRVMADPHSRGEEIGFRCVLE